MSFGTDDHIIDREELLQLTLALEVACRLLVEQSIAVYVSGQQNPWQRKDCVQVTLKYGPELVDTFIEIADAVEDEFPDLQVDGDEEEALEEGTFQIVADDGHVIFTATMADFNSETVIKVLRDSGIS